MQDNYIADFVGFKTVYFISPIQKNVIANLRKLMYTYGKSAMKFPQVRGEGEVKGRLDFFLEIN